MPNTIQTKTKTISKAKTKSRTNKRQRNRRRNKQKLQNGNQNNQSNSQQPLESQISFCPDAQRNGLEIWNTSYENAIKWHGEHQSNFWRQAAERLTYENQKLQQQLSNALNRKPNIPVFYETSDEDEEPDEVVSVKKDDDDEIDSKYLEFLQVTLKHREELRLKREAADLLDEEISTTAAAD